MRPRPLLVASARPVRFRRGLHPVAPACFFCRSRRDGALRRPADISVFTQRHECHLVRGCLVTLRPGWDHRHTRAFYYRRPHRHISHACPHHWLVVPCANDAAVSAAASRPDVARVVRVSVAPRSRSPRTEVSISSSARP
jgi:hypothetical protein